MTNEYSHLTEEERQDEIARLLKELEQVKAEMETLKAMYRDTEGW